MRLLNSTTLQLAEFEGDDIPAYAILSHTWGKDEVTLRDIQDPVRRNAMNSFAKIQACCQQAAQVDKLEWVWVDTCCIDKTSSAELSEAINSMFRWYKKASVCYAFLSDVPPLNPFLDDAAFYRSRWFKRGWTLQELLAPREVEFYAHDWTELGTKWSLQEQITAITAIPKDVLLEKRPLSDYTVAERMSWASTRQTTRVEDTAYSLLGIFDINMPLLYGEGRRAFFRLQQEILTRELDFTIFLWSPLRQPRSDRSAFCDSPYHFPVQGLQLRSGDTCKYSEIELNRSTMYNRGIEPPAIVGKHIRVTLLARADDKREAWMFATHHGVPLCVGIQGCTHRWNQDTEGTAGNSKTIWKLADENCFLLRPDHTPRGPVAWEPVEVHIPAFQDSWTSNGLSAPSEICEFNLILESTPTESLTLLAIEPPYITKISDKAFKIIFSLVDCPPKFAVLLSVKQPGDTDEGDKEIAIVFSLFHGPWSCMTFTKGPILPLRELLTVPIAAAGPLDGQTDRTLMRLPWGMNYLRVSSKRRPNGHRAYVSLLPVPDDERSLARSMGVGN